MSFPFSVPLPSTCILHVVPVLGASSFHMHSACGSCSAPGHMGEGVCVIQAVGCPRPATGLPR
eukprot:8753276-Alexandrium_andersonii.AAC.1